MTISPPPSFEDDKSSEPVVESESSPPDKPAKFPDLVQDVFPSCDLHLIGGSRGAGKTALEIWMERAILRGEPFLGHQTWCPPWWGVLILDRGSEDRLAWYDSAQMSPLPYIAVTEDLTIARGDLAKLSAFKAVDYVEKCLDQFNPPAGGVLTVDVLNFILGDAHLKYSQGFALGMALANMARRRQITILGLVHGGKQKGGQQYLRLTDRIISSTGFLGTASTVSYLTTKEESAAADVGNGYQQFAIDPHHAPAQVFELKRTESGMFELVSEEPQVEFFDIVPITHEEIMARIPEEGWIKSNELYALFPGVVKQTFFNRLWSLNNSGGIEIIKGGRGRQLQIRRKPKSLPLAIVQPRDSDPSQSE